MGPGTCHDQNPLAGIAGVGLLRLLEECVERMLETGLFQPEPSLAPPSPLQEGRKSRGHGSRSARRRPGDALAFASPGGARRNGCHLSGGAVSTLSYWADHIPRGDQACAADPEGQRGALFYRNVALLFLLRYAGSRRAEAIHLCIADVDRTKHLIHLLTKRHHGKHLPVVLYEPVEQAIWLYVTRFRPCKATTPPEEQDAVFLSHSMRNYGRRLTAESVRALIGTLRRALDPPWNEQLTPHMLRYAFGYELQKMGGSSFSEYALSRLYLSRPAFW